MDKKDKMLIVLAPVALLAGGYFIFGEQLFPEEKKVVAQENFSTIEAPITEVRKKRTEIYRDKYEKENGAQERKIESDDSFFGNDEIKEDATDITTAPEEKPSEFDETSASVKKAPEEKPKVIVKYIERPEAKVKETKEVVKEEEVVQEKPARRRTGFVEGGKSGAKAEQTTEDVAAIEIPVVVQDNINVKQGSNITLRTTEQVVINGKTVPKNTLITGIVSLSDQRFNVAVNTIKSTSGTVAVKLKGYDLEGNEGLPLEGGVDKEIKRDVVTDAINASRTVVKVPILSTTPARVGQKKVNDPTVPVPKGYKIFLK